MTYTTERPETRTLSYWVGIRRQGHFEPCCQSLMKFLLVSLTVSR